MSKKLLSEEEFDEEVKKQKLASINQKKYKQTENRRFVYNFLKLVPAEDIVRYTMIAMKNVDLIKSESDLENKVYQIYLYYNSESSYCPFKKVFVS